MRRLLAKKGLDDLTALNPDNPRTNEVPRQTLQLTEIPDDGEADERFVHA